MNKPFFDISRIHFLLFMGLLSTGCKLQAEKTISEDPKVFSTRRYGKALTTEYRNINIQNELFIQGEISQSQIKNSHFRKMRMSGTRINQSSISHSSFENSELAGVIVSTTKIESTSFLNANLTAAKFFQSQFTDIDFSGADLRDAIFLLCTFRNVRFNDKTQLPFSKETALTMGFQYVE